MEGDEGRVKESGRKNGRNILKISTFHEPSPKRNKKHISAN